MPIDVANRRGFRTLRLRGKAVRDGLDRGVGGLYEWLAANRVTRLPWAVIQTFSRAEGALLSGSVAYYTFLSLLPLLLVAGFALGTLARGRIDLQLVLTTAITRLLPGTEGADLLGQLIRSRVTFGLIGLLSVAYAGSGFVGAVTACLNRMWGLPAGRNPIGQKLLNILVVILLGVVLLGSIGVSIWVKVSTEHLFGLDPGSLGWLADRFAGPVMIFIVLVLLYRLLPARRLSWRWQLPGALFGTVVIELLKHGFELWARYSAGVSALPRSLFSVVLLLIWMGFFGQAILYGAAVNVVLHRRRRHLPLFPAPPDAPADHAQPPTASESEQASTAGRDGAAGERQRDPSPSRRRG